MDLNEYMRRQALSQLQAAQHNPFSGQSLTSAAPIPPKKAQEEPKPNKLLLLED